MVSDELDILISRYAAGDSDLSPAERALVERELAISAPANEALATDHRLTELLRTEMPLPEINYELLAASISASIPETPVVAAKRSAADVVPSITANRAFWSSRRMALAACATIVGGVLAVMLARGPGYVDSTVNPATGGGSVAQSTPTPLAPTMIHVVDGSTTTAPPPGGIENVAIGPAPAINDQTAKNYADAGSRRESRVVISGEKPQVTPDDPLSPR